MNTKNINPNVLRLSIVVLAVAGLIRIGVAIAQTEATSTESVLLTEVVTEQNPATSTESNNVEENSATTSESASTSTEPNPTTESTSITQENTTQLTTSQSVSLSSFQKVTVVGTKYIDYFTDGSIEYSFPSDTTIVANFDKPDSAIPSHGDLKWTGTRGYVAYDTPSGDLEEGQYAQQANGSFVVHYPAMKYTSATSTAQYPSKISATNVDPSTQVLSGFSVTQ